MGYVKKTDVFRIATCFGLTTALAGTTKVIIKGMVLGAGKRYGVAWKIVNLAVSSSIVSMVDRELLKPCCTIVDMVSEDLVDTVKVKETFDDVCASIKKDVNIQKEVDSIRDRLVGKIENLKRKENENG